MTTTPAPPRRNRHFARWFIVFVVALFGWSGWRVYAFRSAIKEARALGWILTYTDPSEAIWKNWRVMFEKKTWTDGVLYVSIPTSKAFEQHRAIAIRLNPQSLSIVNASTLPDLSALRGLSRLKRLDLFGCTQLTNVDPPQNLSALESICLHGCKSLTNVDALKNIPTLQQVWFYRCPRLTNVDFLMNLPVLKQVVFTECSGLPWNRIAELGSKLPNAKVLEGIPPIPGL